MASQQALARCRVAPEGFNCDREKPCTGHTIRPFTLCSGTAEGNSRSGFSDAAICLVTGKHYMWPPIISCTRSQMGCLLMALTKRSKDRRRRERSGVAGPSDTLPKTSADFVRLLTDAELCLFWRISHLALQRHHIVAHQLKIVTSRQEYLDEMERRNPAGFARWLYSGARPGSDPTRYLHGTNGTTGQ